jgi:hypothetical protein
MPTTLAAVCQTTRRGISKKVVCFFLVLRLVLLALLPDKE